MALKDSAELQVYVVERTHHSSIGDHLGSGSYGSVNQYIINGLKCAGKALHKSLLNFEIQGPMDFKRKFVEECKLMGNLRHPNIIQFLGVFFSESNDDIPVILMELMHTSLQNVLETYPNFPLSLKQRILKDVSCGMAYLHSRSPPVIHRDLTASNILLNTAMVAKITDFGNSRIVTISPDQLCKTMTCVPGTPVYLPPEAFASQPIYDSKLDVFSFGQVALFTLIQEFPMPSAPTVLDPSTKILIAVSEVQRRQIFIDKLTSLVPSCPSIKELIINCLDNDPEKRPTSLEVFNTMDEIYSKSEEPIDRMNHIELLTTIKEKPIAKDAVMMVSLH